MVEGGRRGDNAEDRAGAAEHEHAHEHARTLHTVITPCAEGLQRILAIAREHTL